MFCFRLKAITSKYSKRWKRPLLVWFQMLFMFAIFDQFFSKKKKYPKITVEKNRRSNQNHNIFYLYNNSTLLLVCNRNVSFAVCTCQMEDRNNVYTITVTFIHSTAHSYLFRWVIIWRVIICRFIYASYYCDWKIYLNWK